MGVGTETTVQATHGYPGHPRQKPDGGGAAARLGRHSAQCAKRQRPKQKPSVVRALHFSMLSWNLPRAPEGEKSRLRRSGKLDHIRGVAYGQKPLPLHSPAPSTLCPREAVS